jgi:hypothetical protein
VDRLIRNPERARRWARSRWFERRLKERVAATPAALRAGDAEWQRLDRWPRESPKDRVTKAFAALLEGLSAIETRTLLRAGIDQDLVRTIAGAVEAIVDADV